MMNALRENIVMFNANITFDPQQSLKYNRSRMNQNEKGQTFRPSKIKRRNKSKNGVQNISSISQMLLSDEIEEKLASHHNDSEDIRQLTRSNDHLEAVVENADTAPKENTSINSNNVNNSDIEHGEFTEPAMPRSYTLHEQSESSNELLDEENEHDLNDSHSNATINLNKEYDDKNNAPTSSQSRSKDNKKSDALINPPKEPALPSLSEMLAQEKAEQQEQADNASTPAASAKNLPQTTQKAQQRTHVHRNELQLTRLDTHLRSLEQLSTQLKNAQHRAARGHLFTSAVAYILFCIIISTLLYFALNYRYESRQVKAQYTREHFEKLQTDLKTTREELDANLASAELAFKIYRQVEEGKYDDALKAFLENRDAITHPAELALLEQKVEAIKWKLADNSYRNGMSFFQDTNYEQARDAFFKSLSYQQQTPNTHLLYYYLATSLYELGDYRGAIVHYKQALQYELGSEYDANARFYLARALERVGNLSDAYRRYETFTRKYRYHRFNEEAKKRMAKIGKKN